MSASIISTDALQVNARRPEKEDAAPLAPGRAGLYHGAGEDALPGRMTKEDVMNEIIKAMEERRSIRKFLRTMPPKEALEQIIEAGLYAASGKGNQSPIIVAVTDREVRDRLSEANRVIGGWKEGFDPFYGAPSSCWPRQNGPHASTTAASSWGT